MNAREREEYLREYSILKSQGKPAYNESILQSPEERAEFVDAQFRLPAA